MNVDFIFELFLLLNVLLNSLHLDKVKLTERSIKITIMKVMTA